MAENAKSPDSELRKKRSLQRSCPGKMEHDPPVRCGRSMCAEVVDGHSKCGSCIGSVCTLTNRCSECESWSDGQMEVYLKRDNFKLSRKLANQRAARKGCTPLIRALQDSSLNNPPMSERPSEEGQSSPSKSSSGDSSAVSSHESEQPWKADVQALSSSVASMMAMLTAMRDGMVPSAGNEKGTGSSADQVQKDLAQRTGPSAGQGLGQSQGRPRPSGEDPPGLSVTPGRQQGLGLNSGGRWPALNRSVDPGLPPTGQHQAMEVDGDGLTASHLRSQNVSDRYPGRGDKFSYPYGTYSGVPFRGPPVPGRDVGFGQQPTGAGSFGFPPATDFGQQQGNSFFGRSKPPTSATVTSGMAAGLPLPVGPPPAPVDLRMTGHGRSTPTMGTGARHSPQRHLSAALTFGRAPQGGLSTAGQGLLGPSSSFPPGGSTVSNDPQGSVDMSTLSVLANPPSGFGDASPSPMESRDQIEQAEFDSVLGWIWEAFPALRPLTSDSCQRQPVLSQTQNLAQGQPADAPTSLPWSSLHAGIDRNLAFQVAGHREGKRDKPLGKGSLLPPRRCPRQYKVEGEPLALEPAIPPPEWFTFTGETQSTVGRSASYTPQDMDSMESLLRRVKVVSNHIDWQMALLNSLTDRPNNQVDIDKVRTVVRSMDRGSTQLAWDASTALANVQLKKRDISLSKLSPMVAEEDRLSLRASAFARPDLFERPRVVAADAALQAATQRKATLGMLEVGNANASYPKGGYSQKKRPNPSTPSAPSAKRKKGKKKEAPKDQKKKDKQSPHDSGPSSSGGGKGRKRR